VERIRWRPGAGEAAGVTARKIIVTVPLPALFELEFDPEPARTLAAARRLEMGQAARVIFLFRERFWDPGMGFLFSTDPVMPTWWTTHPMESRVLTGWSAAHAFDRLMEEGVPEGATAALGRLFGRDVRPLVEGCWWHDWRSDRWAGGAYSYIPAGAMDAPEILAEPVEETLYFAGEHCDTAGHRGTVHGAILSGIRAARQALG
jgi:monoamine oxidase